MGWTAFFCAFSQIYWEKWETFICKIIINLFRLSWKFKKNKKIRLVIELEAWDKDKVYDRLGLNPETVTFFNTELPKIVIPILPGRNNAVLVEAAAMNQKLKYLGLDGAKTLTEKIGKITRGEK